MRYYVYALTSFGWSEVARFAESEHAEEYARTMRGRGRYRDAFVRKF